jgi:hypothetical protein
LVAAVVALAVHLWRAGEMPDHTYTATALQPGPGRVVRVQVADPLAPRGQCAELVAYYRSKAGAGGQVAVHKASHVLGAQPLPWCVDNMDGQGVQYAATLPGQ